MPEPILRGMKFPSRVALFALLAGVLSAGLGVVLWSPLVAVLFAVFWLAFAVVTLLYVRRVAEAFGSAGEGSFLLATLFALLAAEVLICVAASGFGLSQVWAFVLPLLPAFGFYMFLIFGRTSPSEGSWLEWLTESPVSSVTAVDEANTVAEVDHAGLAGDRS